MITTSQIRGARAMLGMTQAELAKRAGISTTGLNNVETGGADPKVSTLRAIRAALESAGVEFTNNGQPGVSVRATAEGILRAGEMARSGGPALPEPTGLAKAILDAGKRRRGEID